MFVGELDLALLITGTLPIQQKLYQRQILYIAQLVTRYNLQNGYTRLASVTNGNSARIIFNFKDGGVSTKKIQTLMKDLQNPGQVLSTKKATNLLFDDVFSASNSARQKVQRSVVFFVTISNDLAEVKENIRKLQNGGIDVTMVVIGDIGQRLINRNDLLSLVGDAKKIVFLESETTDLIAQKVDKTVQLLSPSRCTLFVSFLFIFERYFALL